MAWRGGRGGSRGGRFGGRGSTAAVAKDDDGQIMGLEKRDGPPPLYPVGGLHFTEGLVFPRFSFNTLTAGQSPRIA